MYKIIQELEANNSRLAKEKILAREAAADNQELFNGIRLALDKLIPFGVKQVPTHSGPDGQGLPWAAFKELSDLLYTRKLTGHDARDAIELALSASTQKQWNDWYRRILIKDLRCGVSEKTVNKVLKKVKNISPIPVFTCMLAKDGTKHEKKLIGKKLLEPKLDGIRVITVIDMSNRTVTQYSRNGRILKNFSHITNSLQHHIDDFGRSMVLDGEMVSSKFQALMTQVNRKTNVNADDARLMLFDILPLSEFKSGKSILGQKRRSALLHSQINLFDRIVGIDIIPQIEVDLDDFAGDLKFKTYNKEMVEKGFEGIMIKDVDAKYECKRSSHWLKQKPFIEVSLTIVGVEEGTKGSKNEGKLGALVCEGIDDGKKIKTNVGSGISDDQRDEYWINKDKLLKQVVEVRGDGFTKNQDSDDVWSLRFPRLIRFRGFSVGEKL